MTKKAWLIRGPFGTNQYWSNFKMICRLKLFGESLNLPADFASLSKPAFFPGEATTTNSQIFLVLSNSERIEEKVDPSYKDKTLIWEDWGVERELNFFPILSKCYSKGSQLLRSDHLGTRISSANVKETFRQILYSYCVLARIKLDKLIARENHRIRAHSCQSDNHPSK